jgi:hypothetical protein
MMLVLGEDGWAVVRGKLARNAQAILPEPDDEPKPDDEPDDEADDEPGTLYFGERPIDGPILQGSLYPDAPFLRGGSPGHGMGARQGERADRQRHPSLQETVREG